MFAMNPAQIKMSIMPNEYAIHRFGPNVNIPLDLLKGERDYHISKTEDEISIVCRSSIRVPSDKVNKPYIGLKVLGPLDFSLVGIISRIADVLKKRDIPIFVISTFDTDYILINKDNARSGIKALSEDEYISITNVPN